MAEQSLMIVRLILLQFRKEYNMAKLNVGGEIKAPIITATDTINCDTTNVWFGGAKVIDSGSNANGYWVKFADGTLICRYSFTDKLLSGHTVTFPHPFISTEDLSITTQQARDSGIGAQWINGQAINKVSKTGFNVYAGYNESSTIYWKAIGRWK